jgi:hypothetical protein
MEKIRFINVYLEPFQLIKEMVKPSSSIDANEEKAKSLIGRDYSLFLKFIKTSRYLKDFISNLLIL